MADELEELLGRLRAIGLSVGSLADRATWPLDELRRYVESSERAAARTLRRNRGTEPLKRLERAMGIEPTTFSLGS